MLSQKVHRIKQCKKSEKHTWVAWSRGRQRQWQLSCQCWRPWGSGVGCFDNEGRWRPVCGVVQEEGRRTEGGEDEGFGQEGNPGWDDNILQKCLRTCTQYANRHTHTYIKTHNIAKSNVRRVTAHSERVKKDLEESMSLTHFLLNTGVAEERTVCDRCCLSSPSPSMPHTWSG